MTTITQRKQELFSTARTLVGCAGVPVGTIVAVRWYHHDPASGHDWYLVNNGFIALPDDQLDRFVL